MLTRYDSKTIPNAKKNGFLILADDIPGPVLAALDAGHGEALADVASERRRQITEEGWTPEHDDEHVSGAMAAAGAAYALVAARESNPNPGWQKELLKAAEHIWPWDEEWWKPKDNRSNLVRAAALIIAEIERLDRASRATHEEETK